MRTTRAGELADWSGQVSCCCGQDAYRGSSANYAAPLTRRQLSKTLVSSQWFVSLLPVASQNGGNEKLNPLIVLGAVEMANLPACLFANCQLRCRCAVPEAGATTRVTVTTTPTEQYNYMQKHTHTHTQLHHQRPPPPRWCS